MYFKYYWELVVHVASVYLQAAHVPCRQLAGEAFEISDEDKSTSTIVLQARNIDVGYEIFCTVFKTLHF